jgi:hypothetical protein
MPRQSKFTWRFENEEYVHQRVVDLTMRQLACIDEYLPVARSCLADAFHAAARFEDVETRLPARLAARTAEYLAQRKTPGRPKKEITPEEFDKLRDLVCEYERELAETAASPDRKSRRRGEKSMTFSLDFPFGTYRVDGAAEKAARASRSNRTKLPELRTGASGNLN